MYAVFLQSDIIEGPPGIVNTLLKVGRNICRSTPGNGVMATGMATSVGVGGDMSNAEREGYDWQREQETHL